MRWILAGLLMLYLLDLAGGYYVADNIGDILNPVMHTISNALRGAN